MKHFLLTILFVCTLSSNSFAAILCSNATGGIPGTQATLEAARLSKGCKDKVTVTSILTSAQSNITVPWAGKMLEIAPGGEINNTTTFATAAATLIAPAGVLTITGGKFGAASTGAITLNGPVIIPDNLYVFAGSGAVLLGPSSVKEVPPVWWGAKGDWDGATGADNTLPFQAAINAAQSARVPVNIPQHSVDGYMLTAGLTIDPTRTSLRGNNAVLVYVTASVINGLTIDSQPTGWNTANYDASVTSWGLHYPYISSVGSAISGVTLIAKSVGAGSVGVKFGASTGHGAAFMEIENSGFNNWPIAWQWGYSQWGMNARNCRFASNTLALDFSSAPAGTDRAESIKFTSCLFLWNASVGVLSQADFFFDKCSFDYGLEPFFTFEDPAKVVFRDFHFESVGHTTTLNSMFKKSAGLADYGGDVSFEGGIFNLGYTAGMGHPMFLSDNSGSRSYRLNDVFFGFGAGNPILFSPAYLSTNKNGALAGPNTNIQVKGISQNRLGQNLFTVGNNLNIFSSPDCSAEITRDWPTLVGGTPPFIATPGPVGDANSIEIPSISSITSDLISVNPESKLLMSFWYNKVTAGTSGSLRVTVDYYNSAKTWIAGGEQIFVTSGDTTPTGVFNHIIPYTVQQSSENTKGKSYAKITFSSWGLSGFTTRVGRFLLNVVD